MAGDLDQAEAVLLLAKTKPENVRQAEMLVRDMLASGTTSASQDSLFGPEEMSSSVVLERAKLVDEAQRILAKDKAVFRVLVRDAKQIETAGNTLDPNANQERLTDDERAAQVLTQFATHKGPTSAGLTAIARRLKAGEITRAAGAREFIDLVRDAMAGRDERGADDGRGVAGDAGEGQDEGLIDDGGATGVLFETTRRTVSNNDLEEFEDEEVDAAAELARHNDRYTVAVRLDIAIGELYRKVGNRQELHAISRSSGGGGNGERALGFPAVTKNEVASDGAENALYERKKISPDDVRLDPGPLFQPLFQQASRPKAPAVVDRPASQFVKEGDLDEIIMSLATSSKLMKMIDKTKA